MGSNIDPEKWIPEAAEKLEKEFGEVISSPVYITRAIGRPEQQEYRNALWKLESSLSQQGLKNILLEVEEICERVRVPDDSCAPRTLDLDIIGRGDLFFDKGEIRERDFLRRSILDLFPQKKEDPLFKNTPGPEQWKQDHKLTEKLRMIFLNKKDLLKRKD